MKFNLVLDNKVDEGISVCLSLRKNEDGSVSLVVDNKALTGYPSSILTIQTSGVIRLQRYGADADDKSFFQYDRLDGMFVIRTE